MWGQKDSPFGLCPSVCRCIAGYARGSCGVVDAVVCNVRFVGCVQGTLSDVLLVVVVCALSVAVDSPSFVCLGTC